MNGIFFVIQTSGNHYTLHIPSSGWSEYSEHPQSIQGEGAKQVGRDRGGDSKTAGKGEGGTGKSFEG